MYGTATTAEMPTAFLTDPAAWDVFVGQVWHAVLAPLSLRGDATVIEIAPGSSAKIAHALAAGNFHGTLHLVEASAAALDVAVKKYHALLPAASIHGHAATLESALPDLPTVVDAFLGSHILDDLLLARADMKGTFDWAQSYGDSVSAETRSAWAALSSDPNTLTHIIDDTAAEVASAIAHLKPAHAVLSQYPSATLHDNALSALNDSAYAVLEQIRSHVDFTINDCAATLAQLPHYNNAHIGMHVLNPAYWLSCTRKI